MSLTPVDLPCAEAIGGVLCTIAKPSLRCLAVAVSSGAQVVIETCRCGMCKPGRHHGPGGAKSLKNVRGSQLRGRWLDVKAEARQAEHAAKVKYDVMPSRLSPNLSSRRTPPSLQETAAAMDVPEQPAPVHVLPGPLSISSLRRCQCPDCPQRRRRSRYTIIPESGGRKEERYMEGYETILADFPNVDEGQLEVGQDWALL